MLRTGSHPAPGINAMSGAMAGSIPLNLVSWLSYDARPMPTRELFTWDGSETATSGARGHLWSWMLYHWLWNQRGKAFAEYQKRLAESGDPGAAWRGAFPEFDPSSPEALAKLDEELDRYRTGGRFAFYKVEAQADARFSEAAISSSELHLHRCLVSGSEEGRGDVHRRWRVRDALSRELLGVLPNGLADYKAPSEHKA